MAAAASTSGQGAPQLVHVGVLALQGSFREHAALLQRVPGVAVVEVRSREQLAGVEGLVIPGGESTTMALVAERWGLIPELQAFAAAGKPIWGTCAGMIFLANRAEGAWRGCGAAGGARMAAARRGGWPCHCRVPAPTHVPLAAPWLAGMKKGGQALLGGLDVTVSRNFFGAQVRSRLSPPAHGRRTLPACTCCSAWGASGVLCAKLLNRTPGPADK